LAPIIKKVNRNGNGHCINLDKALMEILGLKEGDHVCLSVRGEKLTIEKAGKKAA
jgi:antitoxin component of MazEF toxin-antitoxin module